MSGGYRPPRTSGLEDVRSESALAIDPRNPDRIVEVYQAHARKSGRYALAAYASRNGGRTWKSGDPLTLPDGAAGLTDPAALWDYDGTVHLLAVALTPGDAPSSAGLVAYRSANGGLTWGLPQVLARAGAHQPFLAADSSPGSPHYGRVYAAWCAGGSLAFACASAEGWRKSEVVGAGCFCPEVLTGPQGDVYVLWMTGQSGTQIRMATSADGGESFRDPAVVANGITSLRGALPETFGWPHFPGAEFRVLTVATGCTTSHNVVLVAWADARQGPSRIYYRHSRDGGAHWEGPASGQPLLTGTNASAPDQQEFLPRLLCTPEGEICCAFYEYGPKRGRREELVDLIVAASPNHGASFDFRMVVTEDAWDPKQDVPSRRGSGRGSMAWLRRQ